MAVEGIRDIQKAFRGLEKAGQIRVLRNSLNAALNPPLMAARASAPRGVQSHKTYKGRVVAGGFLSRRGIKKSTRVGKDRKRVFGNVRLDSEAFYGSFIEHGWRPGLRSKGLRRSLRRRGNGGLSKERVRQLNDSRRKIAGRPWFFPAVNRTEEQAWEMFSSKMTQAIMREWSR